jgi:arabinogalactan oligomer/maltooligosaccharide transport system permease protein
VSTTRLDTSSFQGKSGTQRTKKGWFFDTGWRHVVAILITVFALFPVIWVVSAAFSGGGLQSQSLIPDKVTLNNYRTLVKQPFWTWMRNSMIVGFVTALLTVFLCACAAYAFSRLRFKGRRGGMMLAAVALFLLMQRVKGLFPAIGLGTYWGLILVYLGGALGVNTWLMKGFFDTLPRELDESAKVDGATHAQIFFRIILPLAAPVLAVIGLLSFVASQSEFMMADVIIQNNEAQRTAAVGLSRFVLAGFANNWGAFAMGSLIVAVPVLVLWLFLQRYVVSGLTAGAVKG